MKDSVAGKDKMARVKRIKSKPGIKEISLMLVFQVLQRVSTNMASLMAYHLWFHPGRKSASRFPAYTPSGMRTARLLINRKTVQYWTAGEGDAVLLMHGWAGCGNQMASIAQALLENGFKVIWLDAPAHGASSGWQTNLFEISQSISAIQKREGSFYALVAHSFGVPCSLHAMQNGLRVDKLVAISSPATAVGLIDKYCKIIKANKKTKTLLSQRIEHFLEDMTLADIAAENLAQGVEQECLIIHDKHDRMIRCDEGRALQRNLSHSSFILTQKLGHNKVLSDSQTVTSCVAFIQSNTELKQSMETLAS